MFNAPNCITQVPEIAHIYELNEIQSNELDKAIEAMDNNLFLDKMDLETVERWETTLDITPLDDDSLEERRFRVKAKVMEHLPYSYRAIMRKLDTLCPSGYKMILTDKLTSATIKLALKNKRMLNDVKESMDDMLPLNMTYVVEIIWNQHSTLARYTHKQLAQFTHQQLREEVLK